MRPARNGESTTSLESARDISSQPVQTGANLRANLRKQLNRPGRNFLLEVDFTAPAGFTILFGPSGAGKTTLLNCIAGISEPDAGHIAVGDRTLFDSAQRTSLTTSKRNVGYVFQNLALFPHMTVEQNVHYGLSHSLRDQRHTRAEKILGAFHIAHLSHQSARQISGGEAQRVALARTLVTDPALLLLDEPLAALDAPTKSKIIADLRDWNRIHRIPILYVTHSRQEVFALGERVIVLDQGRILAEGTPHEVMTAPQQETVAQLAGFENIFDATVEEIHPERGTMVCKLVTGQLDNETSGSVLLETPLVRASVGSPLRIGIRAGDILLATSRPLGLSARNLIPGRVLSFERRDVIMSVKVLCGVEVEAHLTLAACDSLQIATSQTVWLVIKTHSCHLMQA
ncbi:MAG TPA: molybdenum ABC transporter ATP-binding protein [Verrucomicrobiae bacterium]|jgi:molybdate transport system ATP-binding protein|nr:molybdenum ABC transporter ATP-binding protein [Verrucomicrobiae bacterium]